MPEPDSQKDAGNGCCKWRIEFVEIKIRIPLWRRTDRRGAVRPLQKDRGITIVFSNGGAGSTSAFSQSHS